jgi:hypothetical protein
MPDQTQPKPASKTLKLVGIAALLFFAMIFVVFPLVRNL